MNTQHYTATFAVDQTPDQVFAAVTNPRAWWSQRLLVAGFLLTVFGPVSAWGQTSTHATVADPDAHRVVFENEHVRVIDARASQGWKSPMHSHAPMVVIVLGSGRQTVTTQDGRKQLVDLSPGTVVWQGAAFDHAWELQSGEVHVILVEVKSARPDTTKRSR